MDGTNNKIDNPLIICLMLVSGAVAQALAFPKWNLAFLAWISLVPLMAGVIVWMPKRPFFQGWLFGSVSSAISFAWVMHSMTVYGGLSWALSGLALALMASFLGLFPAAAVWIAESLYRSVRNRIPRSILWPASWVTMEYIRAHLPFGLAFPWNSLGQTQHDVPFILQNADWGSFYGISFMIVLVNCGIYEILSGTDRWKRTGFMAMMAILAATGYGAGRWYEDESGKPFRIGIVQGNVDLKEKWEPQSRYSTLINHLELSRSLVRQHPGLILWSESSISFLYRYAWRYDDTRGGVMGSHISDWMSESRIPLLTGTLDRIEDKIYNAVVLVLPDGRHDYFYKQQLVPFGEYVPIKKLFFFVNRLVEEQIGEFEPGTSTEPLLLPGGPSLAITICYENIFPNLVRKRVMAGAELICNVTNDAWFGKTSAAYQHFSAARFRAVENRRPVLRCANTGISGAVDGKGRVLAESGLFEPDAFTVDVIPSHRTTVYMRLGDWFALGCLFMISVLYVPRLWGIIFRRKK